MIPAFHPATNALPAGIHESDWAEVVDRFGTNAKREGILSGLRRAPRDLAGAGCTRVYLGGSFVTAKELPGDWDGCFEEAGVNFFRLAKSIARGILGTMDQLFGGEMYNATAVTNTGETFIQFFQHNREGQAVGLIALDPATAR
jgi:hypothetical protein